jgi:DNA-binding response OmpR family regulator
MSGQADNDDAPVGRYVLAVDDDPIMREILLDMLRDEGYAADSAADGDLALQALRARPADLVVLDMIMPNKEGIETLREIKRLWPTTAVIMISAGTRAMGADPLLKTALALGADATLTKPLWRESFVATVASILARAPQP